MQLVVALLALTSGAGACRQSEVPVGDEKPREVAAGKILFERKCASCHGATGNGKTITASRFPYANLIDGKWRGDGSAESIERQIRTGHDPMPTFQGKLTDEEIRQTAAYVAELSRSKGKR